MTDSEFERFAVRTPIREAGYPEVKGRQTPPMIFLSDRQIPEANAYVELAWIHGVPEPNPYLPRQVLEHDQLLVHIGMDHRTPQVLGGTVELYLGGQPIVFNTTTAIFIPKGTPYGPLTWKEFHRPHLQLSIVLGSGEPYPMAVPGAAGSAAGSIGATAGASAKAGDFDYEQYVVRSPMREAGPDYVEGRQNPTMTYMSGSQVPGVKNYLEIGWIWDVPSRPIPRMRHANYDEIVVHIGSDPDHPEDLGATMRFDLGDDLVEFDTTHCVFIPRELNHGPLAWKEVRRPMIELAMMLGAGTWAEGWEGSFFDES
jgi:hypothetical protein